MRMGMELGSKEVVLMPLRYVRPKLMYVLEDLGFPASRGQQETERIARSSDKENTVSNCDDDKPEV
jgi:hypothetical protein